MHVAYIAFPLDSDGLGQGFSPLALSTWGLNNCFCAEVGQCLVHYRMLSRVPGLYPLDASSIWLIPKLGQSTTSPDFTKCPSGAQNCPR